MTLKRNSRPPSRSGWNDKFTLRDAAILAFFRWFQSDDDEWKCEKSCSRHATVVGGISRHALSDELIKQGKSISTPNFGFDKILTPGPTFQARRHESSLRAAKVTAFHGIFRHLLHLFTMCSRVSEWQRNGDDDCEIASKLSLAKSLAREPRWKVWQLFDLKSY